MLPRKLEEFLSDPTDREKELIRKLYWSITSTIPLTPELKAETFRWCVRLGARLCESAARAPSPAIRPSEPDTNPARPTVAKAVYIRHNGQAGGGAARVSIERSSNPPRHAKGSAAPPSPGWSEQQEAKRAAAIQYMIESNLHWNDLRRQIPLF